MHLSMMQLRQVRANGENARRRIDARSRRMEAVNSRNRVYLQSLNTQHLRRNLGNNRQDNFFQASINSRTNILQTSKPPRLGTIMPNRLKRLPFFGMRPTVAEPPTRATAYIYVQPNRFEIKNAEIVARN